jgi:WD40 repeat protein
MSGPGKNFFVTGGTLRPDAPCYVERRADTELYDGLLQGQFCYVLTSRQMGKSSLMVRTVGRLRTEGYAVAVMDLTAIGQNLSVEQWYGGMLERLGQQLDLEDELEAYWEGAAQLSPVQRWFSALRQIALKAVEDKRGLVVFVDEIDSVRSLPFSTDEFFAAIRECYNRRANDDKWERLTFCLLGVATPSDLIQDTRTTPFNIGRRIELKDFSREEAQPLAGGLEEGRMAEIAGRLLDRVLFWTHGQPYLTQRFCHSVSEDPRILDVAGIDGQCDALFLSEKAQERNDNLIFVRERILRSEADRAGLLDTYQQVLKGKGVSDDPSNPLVCVLRLSGITREVEGRLTVRNRIYQRVFDLRWTVENMPDAEVRRQRAAFISGTLRMGGVALLILFVISFFAVVAIRQRVEAVANATNSAISAKEAQYQETKANQAKLEVEESALELADTLARMELQQAETVMKAGRSTHGIAHLAHVLRGNPTNLVAASRLMAALSQRSFARLTMRKNEELAEIREEPYYSPDEGRVIAIQGDEARVFDTSTASPVTPSLLHDGPVVADAREFSPDGGRIVTGSSDTTARIWDAFTGEQLTPPLRHAAQVAGVKFSPDGLRVATVSADRMVRVWDAFTGRPLIEPIQIPRGYGRALFSADGERIVMSPREFEGDSKSRRPRPRPPIGWDIRPGQMIGAMFHHRDQIESAEFSPDGELLLTASRDGAAMIWNVISGVAKFPAIEHELRIVQARFSPDGKRFVTASDDRTARIWDTATGQPLTPPMEHDGGVVMVEFSPDGRLLATASEDKAARLWNVETGTLAVPPMMNKKRTLAARFSPDGQTLVTASEDREIRFWDVATGKSRPGEFRIEIGRRRMSPFRRFPGGGPVENTESITAQFSSDGSRLLTMFNGSYSSDVRVRDLKTNDWLAESLDYDSYTRSARFDPAARWVVTAAEDLTARVWDLASGDPVSASLEHEREVVFADFFPDGRRVFTVSASHETRVWDAESGMPLSEPLAHQHTHRFSPTFREPHYASAVSPDGRWLATPSSPERLQVWEVFDATEPAPKWLPALAEAVVGRRINDRGLFERAPITALSWLVSEMEPSRDGAYAKWGSWFMEDRYQRRISPSGGLSVGQYIEQLVAGDSVQSLREALHIVPDKPAVLSRLSQLILEEKKPDDLRAEKEIRFYSQRAARIAKNDPVLWLDLAETLSHLGNRQAAQKALARAGEFAAKAKDRDMKERVKRRGAEIRELLKRK